MKDTLICFYCEKEITGKLLTVEDDYLGKTMGTGEYSKSIDIDLKNDYTHASDHKDSQIHLNCNRKLQNEILNFYPPVYL